MPLVALFSESMKSAGYEFKESDYRIFECYMPKGERCDCHSSDCIVETVSYSSFHEAFERFIKEKQEKKEVIIHFHPLMVNLL